MSLHAYKWKALPTSSLSRVGEVLELRNVGREEEMETGSCIKGRDKDSNWNGGGRELSRTEANCYYRARPVPKFPDQGRGLSRNALSSGTNICLCNNLPKLILPPDPFVPWEWLIKCGWSSLKKGKNMFSQRLTNHVLKILNKAHHNSLGTEDMWTKHFGG